ncbi:leucyl aminopeptidase [Mycena sp. CBHHK59/15]|nr:leucyl aminopeptidase [Mycena sp. CBHHK59/15]
MSFGVPESTAGMQDKYRLPTNVKPSNYDLTVWTDLKSLKFGGFVTVSLDILENTSAIVLNCSELGLATAHSGEGRTIAVDADYIGQGLEPRHFQFLTALPTGSKAQLKIEYSGALRASMNGYYKSAWKQNSQIEHYALTQFQPTEARAAFPCWDEPLLKATFSITMVSHVETVNISNMPAISEVIYDPDAQDVSLSTALTNLLSTLSKEARWKITQFQATPPMSTYLVAFANGPFSHLEKQVVMPLTTPDVIHQAEFALDVAVKVLPLYETIFDIEYPLPKLDTLVAHDFDMGEEAAQNWGLITGRTSAFLLDPAKASIQARKEVASVQSHEVAHMWFGNITTMEWWNYLYLNEDKIFPEWEVNSSFITRHLYSAMTLDAKRSSHPIEVDCPDANFINQIESVPVLRMLSDYVGEERFLEGVSLYLKDKLYGNSVTSDLWAGISTATGTLRLMIGFPLITVTETSEGIHVRQDRFLDNGRPSAEENETIWSVPLGILTVGQDGKVSVDKSILLEEREKTIPLDTTKSFKLNSGTIGFYRVLYTPERLTKIAIEAAKDDSCFSLDDRVGLMFDMAELSRAGLADLSSFLTLVDTWKNEKEYLVWSTVSGNVGRLMQTFWEFPKVIDQLRAFMRSLFVPLVERLGYEFPVGEPIDQVQLRKAAISGAAGGRDKSVVEELKGRFSDYMKMGDDSRIPPNIQETVFIVAVRFGGREEYEAMLKIIDNPPTPSARDAAIIAIGSTQDPIIVQEIFSYILAKSRDQDVVTFCYGLNSNRIARRLLAKFLMDNYDAFNDRFATNSMLKYLINACLGSLSNQADYDNVKEFFKDKDTSRYSMSLAKVLDIIQGRIAYIERSADDLSDWLNKWEQRSQPSSAFE